LLSSESALPAEGARRRTRRRTVVLQVCANNADSVKSASPKGGKHWKMLFNVTHIRSELIFLLI